MRYPAHQPFVAPALRRPELWRLLAGLGVVLVVIFGLNWALRAALFTASPDGLYAEVVLAETAGATPISALVLLYGFTFMALGTVAAAHHLHGRGAASLIGPSLRTALRDFGQVLGALFLLYAAIALLPPWGPAPGGMEPRQNLPGDLWLLLLPLTIGGLLIQTGAEELLFRGYIQQQLAARFRNPLVWMGAPAVLFALGHYVPSNYGANALPVALWTGLFALVLADLTARAGNLGPAIAVHFMNNLFPIALTAMEGPLSGLALFTLPDMPADGGALLSALPIDLGLMLCAWLAARVAIRR
jgi:membrane protease YdiL (CAAX protease family)